MTTAGGSGARSRSARAPLLAGAVLLAVYLATLAPSVTFWDAGEFIAAIDSFGIPHPPGTPLFILVGRAWRLVFSFLPTALATNLFSAVCTATACTLAGVMLARRTGRPLASAAAVVSAGAMSTVWLNATETEVYSASLLLSVLMLWSASRAEQSGESRWVMLLGFLFALTAPLHASALVAAPTAIVLAAGWFGAPRERRTWRGVDLGVAFLGAASAATGHWNVALFAALLLAVRAARNADARRLLVALLIGLSPLIVMLVRAQFDPAINQGNPSTFQTLLDVVARKQYAVAPPWPRQAPLWLQVSNILEYADWQVALGLAPGPTPHPLRTPVTIAFLALGVAGAARLRRDDVVAWRAIVALLLCGSLGVMLYLNLKAGPSIDCVKPHTSSINNSIQSVLERVCRSVVPSDAPHEARERDYFFALAFWAWGLLAGYGAMRLMEESRRLPAICDSSRRRAAVGAALALVPVLLNWRAVDRRREPDASAPRKLAEHLLRDTPSGGVLLVWGDNDTYPLWFAQRSLGTRRDVLVVTISLLAAPWYRAELERRASLAVGPWRGQTAAVVNVTTAARAAGRAVAFAATVPAGTRIAAASPWLLCGTVWIEEGTPCTASDHRALDTWLDAHPTTDVTESTTEGMLQPLRCPRLADRARSSPAAADSLDSSCNAR